MKIFDIVFCCDTFNGYLDEPGQKGINVMVSKYSEKEYGFVLQCRNADYDDSASKVISIAQTGIKFCPWCGTKLSRFSQAFKEKQYERYKDMLIDSPLAFNGKKT